MGWNLQLTRRKRCAESLRRRGQPRFSARTALCEIIVESGTVRRLDSHRRGWLACCRTSIQQLETVVPCMQPCVFGLSFDALGCFKTRIKCRVVQKRSLGNVQRNPCTGCLSTQIRSFVAFVLMCRAWRQVIEQSNRWLQLQQLGPTT